MSHNHENSHVWQYREISNPLLSTSSLSTLATPSAPSLASALDTTILTTPEHTETLHYAKLFEDFSRWLLSRSQEDRRLFLPSCCALVVSLENSLPNMDTSFVSVDQRPGSYHEDPPAASTSPITFGRCSSPTIPIASGHQTISTRPHAGVPQSTAQPTSNNIFDEIANASHLAYADSGSILTYRQPVSQSPPRLPDILYNGRSPPFWRWSDGNLPAVSPQANPIARPPTRRDFRPDDTETSELRPLPVAPQCHQYGANGLHMESPYHVPWFAGQYKETIESSETASSTAREPPHQRAPIPFPTRHCRESATLVSDPVIFHPLMQQAAELEASSTESDIPLSRRSAIKHDIERFRSKLFWRKK